MHQPLIPTGDQDLQTAAIISNLQHLMYHMEIKDAPNARSSWNATECGG